MRCAWQWSAVEGSAGAARTPCGPAPMLALRAPHQLSAEWHRRCCGHARPPVRTAGCLAAAVDVRATASAEAGPLAAEPHTFPRPAAKADYSKATIKARIPPAQLARAVLLQAEANCRGCHMQHQETLAAATGDRRRGRGLQCRQPDAEERPAGRRVLGNQHGLAGAPLPRTGPCLPSAGHHSRGACGCVGRI